MKLNTEQIKRALEEIQKDLAFFEEKYKGAFAEDPHVGLGNKKTRCVNEATLPIVTCDASCLQKCAGTCYVLTICTASRPSCRACEAKNTVLRRIDPKAYYEHFYREAERLGLPIRLSDGGDFENEEQVKACIAAARRHPSVRAIAYTKRINLLPLFLDRPATLHVRYSSWEGDEVNTAKARELGFDVTHVVYDGSGNCPYQKTLARWQTRQRGIARTLRAQGLDTKTAKKQSEKAADKEITVWHCRDCARHGTGCCGVGDIRFNVVGSGDWAKQAQKKRVTLSHQA